MVYEAFLNEKKKTKPKNPNPKYTLLLFNEIYSLPEMLHTAFS